MLDRALVALESEQSTSSYPELLTIVETAEALGVAPDRVEAALAAGDLPAKLLCGTWRIIRIRLSSQLSSAAA